MGTHAAIAMKVADDKYLAIYCHWDGYKMGVGAKLKEYYTDSEKVKKLISLGNISSLGKEVDIPEGVQHSFDKPANDVTVAYGRDRGETGQEAISCVSAYDIKCNIDSNNNVYIFEDGKWTYNGVEL